jgi:alpha-D-ribose-1-phosphate 5-kinase (ATP)
VTSLGEIGGDYFGQIISHGLRNEGVATGQIIVNAAGATPVAGIMVDAKGEPAYLGFPGELNLAEFPDAWRGLFQPQDSLFVDGWIDQASLAAVNLQAMRAAHETGMVILFDPGPGNPRQDNSWHKEAAALATAVSATESELLKLTGADDYSAAAKRLLEQGVALVIVKRGAAGIIVFAEGSRLEFPGLPVQAADTTGAGDSLAGAVLFGLQHDFPLGELGALANATGAAKVMKVGTGHNLPTKAEIMAVLEEHY